MVVAPVWVGALSRNAYDREAAIHAAVAQNHSRALILDQYVSRTLDAANIAAAHMAELYERGIRFAPSNGRPAYIEDPIGQNPAFLALSMVAADGTVLATTLRDRPRVGNVRAEPDFARLAARDPGQLFVSKPKHSRLLGRDTLWLMRRINHSDGSFAGAVSINLDPAQLTTIFGEAVQSPSEGVWVVGIDGIIRSRRLGGARTNGENVRESASFLRQFRAPVGDIVAPGIFDPRVRLISYRRLANYPLYVTFSAVRADVLRTADRRGGLFLWGAALITLLVAMVAGVVISTLHNRDRRTRELALANARLEDAQRIARTGNWEYRFSDGRIAWSTQLHAMYEQAPGEPAVVDVLKAFLDDDAREAHDAAVARLVAGSPRETWEVWMTLPSGRRAHHLVSAVSLRDADGAVTGLRGTTQDITERKQLESLQSDLAHMARVGEMNALAATLSHELTQPLTAAGNYLSAARQLADRPGEEWRPSLIDAMRQAQAQVARTVSIIQRMRNLVSRGDAIRAVVGLDEVIDEALAIVAMMRACRGHVRLVHAAWDVRVEVDSVQIQQVVLNLVRNACEAQQDVDLPPPRVEIDDSGAEQVVIRVVDHGPGLSPAVRARLFEPFASSKPGGLGLGLSICRTIIEAHGGALRAENNAAGGASFYFTLPIHSRRMRDARVAVANG